MIKQLATEFGLPPWVIITIAIIAAVLIISYVFKEASRHFGEQEEEILMHQLKQAPVAGDLWYYKDVSSKEEGLLGSNQYIPWPVIDKLPVEVLETRGNWVRYFDEDAGVVTTPFDRFHKMFMMDTYGDFEEVEEVEEEESVPTIEEESLPEIPIKPVFNTVKIDGKDYIITPVSQEDIKRS